MMEWIKCNIEIVAILFSPLIAVVVASNLQKRKEIKDRKFKIYQNLMSNRKNDTDLSKQNLSLNLNSVETVFHNRKKILEKYYLYRDELLSTTRDDNKRNNLFLDLAKEIAIDLGHKIDKKDISDCIGINNL